MPRTGDAEASVDHRYFEAKTESKGQAGIANVCDECCTRKPDAGNLHVRFEEGEGTCEFLTSPSLLYSEFRITPFFDFASQSDLQCRYPEQNSMLIGWDSSNGKVSI